jgi:hypothetical protein
MPFTLAHPAAVLPLRRYCPRLLSFPALILGSMSPDLGYLCRVDRLSHRWFAGLSFCLPAGLLMLVALYYLRKPTVGLLPARYKKALLPACEQPLGGPVALVFSLLIGVWSHLFWDSFTHNDGWFVEHWAVLQSPVLVYGHRTARVCHVLWYGFSFVGIVWLFLAFERWKERAGGMLSGSGRTKLQDAILMAIVVLPVEAIHHLVHGKKGLYLAAGFGLLVVIGIMFGMRNSGAVSQK